MRGSRGQHRRWVWHLAHENGDEEQTEIALRDVIRWWPRGKTRLLMHCFASVGLVHGMQLMGMGNIEVVSFMFNNGYPTILLFSLVGGIFNLRTIADAAVRWGEGWWRQDAASSEP